VFCEDIDHAERMRQALVNECRPGEKEPQIRDADHRGQPEGKAELYNFTDPESRYPVIATTSKLMSTGVDPRPPSSSCWTRTSSP
jgi:type I restriction enzyme R subunit